MAKPRTARVADIVKLMEAWAPSWSAESWDRVGLFTGQASAPAGRVWVALELGDELLAQALAAKVQMLLLHHPPMFKPLNDLRSDRPATARLLKAAQAGLALFAAHTNLDAAPGGVNDALAARAGLLDTRPLTEAGAGRMAKLVAFVPADHLEAVAQALFAAGAGRIGEYRDCFFHAPGTGGFLAPPEGRPFVGQAGQRAQAAEERLEVLLPLSRVAGAIDALRAAHPYEEPALDVYPLHNAPAGLGLGRVGRLEPAQEPGQFLARLARDLGAAAPWLAGRLPDKIERVAVLGGSGGDLLGAAAQAGAQLLVTGEARHHAAQEAEDLGIGLACLGHYQTELVVVEPWAARVRKELDSAGLQAQVTAWTQPADPWRLLTL